jgi:hypothetical protein
MAWRKHAGRDPLEDMPAELCEFDPREWAVPGEEPDYDRWRSLAGDDDCRCHRRYTDAPTAWFRAHPDANFLDWIRARRARRSIVNGPPNG